MSKKKCKTHLRKQRTSSLLTRHWQGTALWKSWFSRRLATAHNIREQRRGARSSPNPVRPAGSSVAVRASVG